MFSFLKKKHENNVKTSILSKETKVRLVAIAKDEAAYLAVWVYHHLHFGFDDVEVYVNNTTDGTIELLDKIKQKYPVDYIVADYMFSEPGCKDFQEYAYNCAYKKALEDKVTHLLFLDIDEFWTPLDFKSNINTCIKELHEADIISFEWVLKRNEEEPFSFPFHYANVVNKNHFVKSLFKTSLNIQKIEAHNIKSEGAVNMLANGMKHPRPYEYCVDDYNINYTPVKKYFILHRMWRSQLEYMSLLGQGMRQTSYGRPDKEKGFFEFKGNRDGYLLPKNRITMVDFDKKLVDKHAKCYNEFVVDCDIENIIKDAYLFVFSRCFATQEIINKQKSSVLIKKITTNIDPEVVERERKLVKKMVTTQHLQEAEESCHQKQAS